VAHGPDREAAVSLHSSTGRWILAGSVLGSGAVFLEGTVVNVALPAIARDFHLGVDGLQWVINGYLLTLSALMLFGGSLGDRFRRSRVFAIGCVAFASFTIGCALAPALPVLVVLRLLQGMAGALLVPNSLAMLETSFDGQERGEAIGQWAGWSAVSTALGPLAGGWLVDAGSWRWVFASVAPFALGATWISLRHVRAGDRRIVSKSGRLDYLGAILATVGLAGLVGALIVGPSLGFGTPLVLGGGIAGVLLLLGFVARERPVVLILDDLQWADASTVLLLSHMLQDPDPVKLLVVATMRETGEERSDELPELLTRLRRQPTFERLPLEGLDAAETQALVLAREGHDVSDELMERL